MPIFEMPVKYPPYVLWNSNAKRITGDELDKAMAEFNSRLTSARESLNMWFLEPESSESEWVFGGVLTIDTDGAIDSNQSPQRLLLDLADRLDSFLAGRFYITGRSTRRSFGEVTERSKRPGEPVIVDVTVDELLGKDARDALTREQFIQDKLAKVRTMYFRSPDGSFSEVAGPTDDEPPEQVGAPVH